MMKADLKAIKSRFLDRPEIIAAVGKKNATAMARVGGFIMTTARRSIREGRKFKTRKRRTRQGNLPKPRSWVGTLKNKIFFWYDTGQKDLYVGPEIFPPKNPQAVPTSVNQAGRNVTVPSLLEFGGKSRNIGFDVIDTRKLKRKKRSSRRKSAQSTQKRTLIKRDGPKLYFSRAGTTSLSPFPYMRPAMDTAIKRGVVANAFRQSVGK